MVLVSLSLLAGSDPQDIDEKFEKNQYKQEPSYFYSTLAKKTKKEAKKRETKNIRAFLTFQQPHKTMNKIHLPEKILMLSASMPDRESYLVQLNVDSRAEAVRIFINESNIGDFSIGLRDIILERIEHLTKNGENSNSGC